MKVTAKRSITWSSRWYKSMRNIRTRRRLEIVLTVLLIVCALSCLSKQVRAFVPQMKNFAETKIENALGGRSNFP